MMTLLASGVPVTVDDEDLPRLLVYKWYVNKNGVVFRNVGSTTRTLQSEILDLPPRTVVRFLDGNRFNFQKENLVPVDRGVVQHLRKKGCGAARGVYQLRSGRWVARIQKSGHMHNLGSFDTLDEAVEAYDAAAKELYGQFAFQNQRRIS